MSTLNNILKKELQNLILRGKDLPDVGLEVLKNASRRDAKNFAKGTREGIIRSSVSPEGDTYTWDAYYATHKPVSEALGAQLGELEPNEADWLTDVFKLDKGRMKSLQIEPYVEDLSEEEAKSFHDNQWRNIYKYLLPLGATAIEDEQKEYAAGGLVSKEMKALKLLLQNLKKTDADRLARAKEAGFDIDNIYLHGTLEGEIGSFSDQASNELGHYFTDNPQYADLYAQGLSRGRYGKNKITEGSTVYPVFLRKGTMINPEANASHAEMYQDWLDALEGSYGDDFVQYLKDIGQEANSIRMLERPTNGIGRIKGHPESIQMLDPQDIRSIFNDFTPESLADEKFASGGIVKEKQEESLAALRAALHMLTLGSSDTTMGTLGALYAAATRPELFDDTTLEQLVSEGQLNSRQRRKELERDNPKAYLTGELAPMLALPVIGGESLTGQMAANAALNGAYDLNDTGDPMQALTSASIGAAIPPALKYWKIGIPAAGIAAAAYLNHKDEE